jgi:chromosome segregation ATPase
MSEEPTKNLTGDGRTFEERVLAEFALIHNELSAIRSDQAAIRSDQAAMRSDLVVIRGEIAALDQRLTALEQKVDARLGETRQIWEAVQTSLERLDKTFDNVIRDLYEVRADIGLHDKRLREIERRLNV